MAKITLIVFRDHKFGMYLVLQNTLSPFVLKWAFVFEKFEFNQIASR